MSIRALLADDHRIFREGLGRILEDDGGVEVVGEAANGLEAVELAAKTRPDVVIMDIRMTLGNGIEATRKIARKGFGRVVVLSMCDDEATVIRAREAGARGFVTKSSAGRELIDALHAVHGGERYISRDLPPRLRKDFINPEPRRGRGTGPGALLTPRQCQVLQLVAEGKTNKEIGALLGIAVETVKSHRKNLRRVLGVKTTAEMIVKAYELGLIDLPNRPPSDEPSEP